MTKEKNNLAMLYVLFAAAFVAAFNENIINVALTDIMAAFSIDANTANWLVTGYMIVTTIVVTTIAFLLRRFNLRTVFLGSALLFIVGSVTAYFALTFPLLLVCRLLQAVGTGVFIPTMMNSTLTMAPRKKLGLFLSIGGCCITFGPAFGPVISGLMVTLMGWRGIFVVPIAAMLLILVIGMRLMDKTPKHEKASLDLVSLGMSVVGLTSMVYAVSQIASHPALALPVLLIAIVILALFVRRQGSISNPLLNLEPMKNKRFAPSLLLVVVAMMSTFSMSVLLPLFFQGAADTSALLAGVLILIPILINAATAVAGGRLMDAIGEWPLLPLGFLLIVVGQVAVSLVSAWGGIIAVVLGSCLAYAGVGFVFSPSQTAGLKTLTREENPFGVSIMNTFIQLSAAIGPSLYVGVLSSVQSTQLAGGMSTGDAIAKGFGIAMAVAAGVAAVGTLVALVYARAVVKQNAAVALAVSSSPQATTVFTLAALMKQQVYTVDADAPVHRALKIMLQRQTSGLPVVDDKGSVVGFISDGDIMKSIGDISGNQANVYLSLSQLVNAESLDERILNLMESSVSDLATKHVISVEADTAIEAVCSILSERHIKKMPVLEKGKLVGTVSRSDVNRFLMSDVIEKGKIAAHARVLPKHERPGQISVS